MNNHRLITVFSVLFLIFGMVFLLTACDGSNPDTYDEILDAFRTLLQERENSTSESGITDPIMAALIEVAARCDDPAVMAYSLHDINDDGTKELILTETDRTSLHAIFTLHGEKAVLLDVFKYGIVKTDGCIYFIKESAAQTTYNIKYLIDGALEGLTYGYNGSDPTAEGDAEFFRVENGIHIDLTRDEYLAILNSHQMLFMPNHTLETGLYTIPLFPTEDPDPAPTLSVTTYDEVLSLCREIVEIHIPRKAEYKENSVNYRDLYTFPDARTYGLYNRLYSKFNAETSSAAGYYHQGSIGYDILDLNGDGSDEMILLREDYSVLAILTLRDGLPVVLSTNVETIDADGRFSSNQAASDDRNVIQYFLWDIADGRLRTLICVQFGYSEAAGKYIPMSVDRGRKTAITEEEYNTLYEQSDLCPDGYTAREANRVFSGLSFRPLLLTEPAHLNTTVAFERDPYMISFAKTFTPTDSHSWETEFDFFAPTASDGNAYLPLTAVITESGGIYRFDCGVVRGRIEPIAGGFWLIPEEITDSGIVNKPYLYFYEQN